MYMTKPDVTHMYKHGHIQQDKK